MRRLALTLLIASVAVAAIIDSMTAKERRNHMLINGSRRRRIARGSGTTVQQVNQLLKQYGQARKMMRGLTGGSMGKRMSKRMAKMKMPAGPCTRESGCIPGIWPRSMMRDLFILWIGKRS